ncbi:hypothetical protein [Ramlibacter tataouinensis]|uniref:Uncharacterized protein n=1 Tax=Ramlibacter tataouinensis (strain ATCC BAA-407 / DSM 14655 / LMG 21543 / TTB310) TaxID=365046 RepID=F5XYP1_RAMTT|nr:hypothetical protein [Ramlibacter tataouinensis]AEG94408.1 hypothetical protein Rta_32970 [Ramlibacter tataouinensis TTB310]
MTHLLDANALIIPGWLAALAIRHKVRLLTFDAGIAQLLATSEERQQHLTLLN